VPEARPASVQAQPPGLVVVVVLVEVVVLVVAGAGRVRRFFTSIVPIPVTMS